MNKNLQNELTYILDLVNKQQIQKALIRLQSIIGSSVPELSNEIILLSYQWNEYDKEKRLGFMTREEEKSQGAKLLGNILAFIQQVQNDTY